MKYNVFDVVAGTWFTAIQPCRAAWTWASVNMSHALDDRSRLTGAHPN